MVPTRRTFLRVGAAVGITGLAGCSEPLLGSERPPAAFRDWLYEPGTVADVDHYLSLRYRPATIANRAGSFDRDVYDTLQAFGSRPRDRIGVGFAATEAQLVFGQNSVIVGDFEADEVEATLKENGFIVRGEYAGFDVLVDTAEDTAVGIGSSAVVTARSTGLFGAADDAERILQAILDVNAGNAEGYVDDSDDLERLLDELGDGTLQSVRTHQETESTDTDEGQFAGEVARGIDSELNEDSIDTTFVLVFTQASDIDTADIEDWIEANDDATFANFESVDISTSDRVALVSGTEPTAAYDFYLQDF